MSLAGLARRVRHDLACLEDRSRAWTLPRQRDGKPVLDVLIVGAGQSGLAVAFGLRRERITNVRLVDRNGRGAEGPWRRFARMTTLRTLKDVTGIDLGIPSLTLRAYYEARFGRPAWERIEQVPPAIWQDYLDWYRDVLDLPVENETALTGIDADGDLLVATLRRPGGAERVHARKIVLASGIEGSGGWRMPRALVADIPAARYAHSTDDIDFRSFAGKRVAVLGAGPAAFDNAAAALEAGAARVELCCRRPEIPRVNPLIWTYFNGMLGHFGALPDLDRWRFMRHVLEALPTPPPQDAFWRCRRHDTFVLRTGCAWQSVRTAEDHLLIESATGRIAADFIIFATGFETDLAARPELRTMLPHIALWRDRFTPPPGEASDLLGRHAYLGDAFEFRERVPGTAPYLARLHNFTPGAMPSLGLAGGAVTGLKYGVRRLVEGLARDLFREDAEAHYRALLDYADPELRTLDGPVRWIEGLAAEAIAGSADRDDGLAELLAELAGTAAAAGPQRHPRRPAPAGAPRRPRR